MRKSLEAIKGDKLQNIRNNKIYLVGDVSEAFLLVDVETQIAKLYTKANIRRWFRMYEEYVAPVEPVQATEDLNLDEDLEVILEQLGCTAKQRKEYLGIYKEGYRGCVAMLRTSKKGNLHIDMKEKIYKALDEEVRQQIEVKYDTGIYDRNRGYFRISECDNLKVLAVVLKTAINM
ncbi:MAG: hypothetical protein PUJ51_11265 [Clostridiales bacterium]|nr:hypothetical protein [Clostridiales bacterium]